MVIFRALFRMVSLTLIVMLWSMYALGARSDNNRMSIGLLSSGEVNGALATRQGEQKVKGRLNLDLVSSPEMLKKGLVQATDVTLVLFGVDYQKIGEKRPYGKSTGALGFSIDHSRQKNVSFKYDAQKRLLSARIAGLVDSALLSSITLERSSVDSKGFNDFFEVPRQKAMLDLRLRIDRPIPLDLKDKPVRIKANVSYRITVDPFRKPKVTGYSFIGKSALELDIFGLRYYETAKELCVQPVQIAGSSKDPDPTGDYLAVGMIGATTEWAKADVTFKVRRFKKVINSAWKIASSSEHSAIRASVEDDDCIEIFFVENHTPVDLYGGGAAWGGGNSTSQIVTSDGNNNGIDNTHLAHELGHVIDLRHPWSAGNVASYGTLMCGSGWENDNPEVNSQENKDKLSNPLLVLTLKRASGGGDCQNSADCGPC